MKAIKANEKEDLPDWGEDLPDWGEDLPDWGEDLPDWGEDLPDWGEAELSEDWDFDLSISLD